MRPWHYLDQYKKLICSNQSNLLVVMIIPYKPYKHSTTYSWNILLTIISDNTHTEGQIEEGCS